MKQRASIKNATALVTGGAGFIGSHLADQLLAHGAKKVVIVDNFFLGSEENISEAVARGAVFFREDIEIRTSLEYIFKNHSIDIVFNCATKPLNYSFINPANAYLTNVLGLNNLLELQRAGAFKSLCHFSTSEVYGTALYEPMDEKHPFAPTTTYAAGKAASDLMLQSYVKMFDLDAFIVRPFNNYGPRQNYRGPLAAVIPLTVGHILRGESPEIHGTGSQSRDFIFVKDTVKAVIKCVEKVSAGDGVNISTDGQVTIKTLIEKICRLMDFQKPIVYREARKADVACHQATNKKLRSLIDFPITPFDDGLKETVEWYRKMIRL